MKRAVKHDLDGEKILVTGGAGFVGSALVRELLKKNVKVVVYDNFLHGSKRNLDEVKSEIVIVPGDILDEWKLLETVTEHKIDYVFHCVGDTYVPIAYDVPKRFFRVNVEGTLNVLMACKLRRFKRMLYVSSTEVYGEALTPRITEEHLLLPLNTYAVSKLAADRLCFTFFHEHAVPVVVARIFNCYGPRETQPYVIPEIITQLSKGNTVELGNIRAKRDFTYVEDTARALIAVMESDISNGEAVNVGSDALYSVEELAYKIGALMGHEKISIKINQDRMRKLDIQVFRCDHSKLTKHTGWEPEISLDEGLKRTIEWFNSHGKRWSWEDFVEGTIMYRR